MKITKFPNKQKSHDVSPTLLSPGIFRDRFTKSPTYSGFQIYRKKGGKPGSLQTRLNENQLKNHITQNIIVTRGKNAHVTITVTARNKRTVTS